LPESLPEMMFLLSKIDIIFVSSVSKNWLNILPEVVVRFRLFIVPGLMCGWNASNN
jgi:hypothetical protein